MKKKFEDNMEKIAEIAKTLETGSASLEVSLKLYKEAVETAKLLKNELDNAKGTVVILQKELDGALIQKEVSENEF